MSRKILLYLLMFGIVFLVLEAFAWLIYAISDTEDLFDHREMVLKRLNDEKLPASLDGSGDTTLGWSSRGPKVWQQDNCEGSPVEYSVDKTGARVYTGYDGDAARIVIVGDSYTAGDEAGNDATYPAQLASMLGVSVANHGVGGYGPTQAFLNLKRHLDTYPKARVAVLGIMYENLYRMVNAYRPVLYAKAPVYGFKPYMAQGEIQPHPEPQVFESIDRVKAYVNAAFDTDFWAKPRASFPYSFSLIETLGTNYFYFRRLQKLTRHAGLPEYLLVLRSPEISTNLLALLDEFAHYTMERNIQPVVIFIPRNRYDTQSVSTFIEENKEQFNPDLLIGDVARADIDWDQFNLEEPGNNNICHPSAYGYRKVAAYLAELMRTGGVWPPRPE